jgi:hypothetical protein
MKAEALVPNWSDCVILLRLLLPVTPSAASLAAQYCQDAGPVRLTWCAHGVHGEYCQSQRLVIIIIIKLPN